MSSAALIPGDLPVAGPSTAEVYANFGEQLRQFVRRRVSDPQDAEDLLQDIFVKIHTRLHTLQDRGRLAPWLFQVARNTIADHYRSRNPGADLPDDLAGDPESEDPSPEAHLASGLGEMIAELPETYRQALLLSELQGLPQAEVARRMGLSLSGAKSRVQRGRERLRQALFECCHFEFDRRGGIIDFVARPECCQECR